MPNNEGFKPGPIPAEALAYMRAKTVVPGFDHRDVWREAHATAFTVAKAMQIDVLESIQDALDQAMAEGRTFQQFAKELAPTLQKLGWWGESEDIDPLTGKVRAVQLGSPRRLKTIYDTNMTVAHQAGQWARIQRNKATAPYLKYVLGPSKEHRTDHAQWAGTILPVDHEWWSTHRPKNGWGCKCGVIALSEFEAARQGGVTPAPEVKTRRWVNKRTGEVTDVPMGIDPGWDFNPGAVALDVHSANVFSTKLKTASADVGSLAAQSAGDFVRANMRRDFERWVSDLYHHRRHHGGGLQLVGMLDPKLIKALRAEGIELQTAAITLTEERVKHLARASKAKRIKGVDREEVDQRLPELDVQKLSEHLSSPMAVLLKKQQRDESPSLVYLFKLGNGRVGMVAAKFGYRDRALIGQRTTVETNSIRTAGTVTDVEQFRSETFYKLLRGAF